MHSETTCWANTNGFRISKGKTQFVHFCQLRKMSNDPLIKFEDTEISVVDEYKFLWVIFDRKLTFIPYIEYIKTESTQTQQLLRVVTHSKWGADRQTPLKLYWSLIRKNSILPFLSKDQLGVPTLNSSTLYWMNYFPKQKPIPVLIRGNFAISSNTIPTIYVSLRMAPRTMTKRHAQLFLHAKWQQRWNNNIYDKLFQILPTSWECIPAFRKLSREQILISRLRIDHTWLTQSFILKQEP